MTRVRSLLAAVAIVALTGCGGHGTGAGAGNAKGAKVFASAGCGSCHTLAAAKSKGQIGPNLDQRKPGYDAVVRQVSNGGAGMPPFSGRLSTKQIRDVAAYVVASTGNSVAGILAFKPNKTKLADCHADYLCFKQAFGNVAYYDGPQRALSELAATMRTNELVNGGCHQIAHEIGHAAYLHYNGDAAQALAHGAMTCWSGYYHGVIERAFGGVPKTKVAATARRLCSGRDLQANTFLLYQCVHGLGHGLMIYSQNDLPYALHVCHQLQTSWDQTSCTGGVFMQNFLPGPMQMMPTRWLSKKNLIYPCNVVAKRDKLYCYLTVTSRILPEVGYRWAAGARWCRRVERGWVETCFQSFGRDASGYNAENAQKIVTICRVAGDMERACIYGAARDVTSNDANGIRATRMCLLAPPATRLTCFAGIGTILGNFANDATGRRSKCDESVPPRWRAACYRGANA